jgi:hypothetical protein
LVLDLIIAQPAVETFWTPSDMINALTTQLGLPSQASSIINIKVQRVDAYTMSTGASTDRPAISMDVSSVTPSIGDPTTPGNAEVFYGIMKKLSDQGNLSDAAKVSYTWPTAMADVPLSSQSVFALASVAGNQPNTAVRFHLLWSTTDIATPQAQRYRHSNPPDETISAPNRVLGADREGTSAPYSDELTLSG